MSVGACIIKLTTKGQLMDFEAMAIECSRLMDEVEVINAGGRMSTEDENPDERMKQISDYATLLSYFRPDLLDPRFG
jgi:hypothetical protein